MNERELRDLVGDDARLRRAHDALVQAGPPPELPSGRAEPPWRRERRWPRQRLAAALVAAVLLAASLAVGYLIGKGGEEPFGVAAVVEMGPTGAAPRASASIEVGEADDAGNWPMTMTVSGLPALPPAERYELVLTRDGAAAASCGFFVVESEGSTDVFLNAPYRLREFDGWAVTRAGDDELLLVTERL